MPSAIKNAICRFCKCTGCFFIFSFAAQIAFSQTTYEAESAVISNGARVADCKNCSDGRQVGFVGGDQNGTVKFEQIVVPRAGLYPMAVLYNIGDRPFTVTVNTNTRMEAVFEQTAPDKSNGINRKTIFVPLNAGENTIAFNNAEEFALARIPKSFRPIEGDTGNQAANLFSFEDGNNFYVAAFNYSNTNANFNLNFNRAGFTTHGTVLEKELWSNAMTNLSSPPIIKLGQTDAALYEFRNN